METHEPESGVLVLGSDGFVGRALVARLLDLGHRVFALGRGESGPGHGRLEQVRGDIGDDGLLRAMLPLCGSIVHAATRTTPGESARKPGLEVSGNLLPLTQLLECAADFPGRRLVYLSSAGAVYGDLARDADETTPLRPRSFYGAGKAAAEAFIHAAAATSGWEAIVLRPTNLYGPGQHASSGFAVVPTLLKRALDGQPFPVWGDGENVRDYCFITDLVDLIAKVLRRPMAGRFQAYNVATGHRATLLQLIASAEQACGHRIKVQFFPPRDVDVPCVSPSGAMARRDWDWQPRIALGEGLAITWEWFKRLEE